VAEGEELASNLLLWGIQGGLGVLRKMGRAAGGCFAAALLGGSPIPYGQPRGAVAALKPAPPAEPAERSPNGHQDRPTPRPSP